MRVKGGVSFAGAQPELLEGLAVAERVAKALGHPDVLVTSVVDGRHKRESKHYQGLAADLRTFHYTREEARGLTRALQRALGASWDVLYEDPDAERRDDGEHIHMEYDPK